MDKLKNVIVYIDDLLIHSKTHEDHLVTLDEVLQRLTDNNMKINLAKCHFGNTEVSYLATDQRLIEKIVLVKLL